MRRAPNRLVPVVYLTAAIAGVAAVGLGDREPTTFLIGLALAAVAGTIAVAAWRRSTPVRDTQEVSASWWKFLVAGPCLVAVVIIAASAGVDAWYLGMVVVLGAVISTAMGFILAVAHFFRRRVGGSPA